MHVLNYRVRTSSIFMLAIALAAVVACSSSNAAEPTAARTATVSPTATPITSDTFGRTATPVPTRSSAVEPYPTRTPTPTSTPTPEPMRVVRLDAADFGEPVSGTVYEELLARLPDNDGTRSYAKLADNAGFLEAFGIERPQPGADSQEVAQFYERLSAAWVEGLIPDLPSWPLSLRDYLSVNNWFSNVAFDAWSADQSVNAGDVFRLGHSEGPPLVYDIAFGKFDPELTANALAACDCDQPTIRVHDGVEYYSWGTEFIGQIELRHTPPMYDHIGRGPSVLVREGEGYYSISYAVMENMIDVLEGNEPSLADDAVYASVSRWIASLGLMRDVTFFSRGFSLDDALATSGEQSRDPALFEETARKTELFSPFGLVATGVGYDGERPFTGIVISNPDESSAEGNAEIFAERLRTVPISVQSDETYGDQLKLIEIAVEDNLIIARLYYHLAERHQFGFPFPFLNTWLIYE